MFATIFEFICMIVGSAGIICSVTRLYDDINERHSLPNNLLCIFRFVCMFIASSGLLIKGYICIFDIPLM